MEEKRISEEPNNIQSMENNRSNTSEIISDSTKSPVRSIESPKYSLSLSPIQNFLKIHSPRTANSPTMSISQPSTLSQEFPFDPQAQKVML